MKTRGEQYSKLGDFCVQTWYNRDNYETHLEAIINKKIKIIIIVAAITVFVATAGFYYFSGAKGFLKTEGGIQSENTKENTPSIKSPANVGQQTSSSNTSLSTNSYVISGLNKSDGDIFSLPDNISFTIMPNVSLSRVRLIFQDGTTIYDQSVPGSNVNLTIYPGKKLAKGDIGTVIIDGIKDSKVVVSKEVKVVF